MVDNQGDWQTVLAPFKETEWNGIGAADTVFPTFLFIMGVAVPIGGRAKRKTFGVCCFVCLWARC